ncbi:helix-turn-helix transcriptional regulator [Marinactinospora thermotolerans]|uniref:Predicted DNA-binding transcriptional regulator YafY, contains an HTH and WYL domains n=1 Tax=Marinactinospora thermotolerans DSM 45154 TaxID=1122192 RepID=A0A1T4KG89_9ACTN|nr:WYL domain-containing protein [Marinactinospora thermotolerans]SJZ41434.1 Predicted DNA-binding transcriptional regulator YafY, contains an HTH and WYL domains [Marinactinospora thermotolerans DSM 45154]
MTPDRFFSLLLALQTRESSTTSDLAAQVGVSVRTVLRDLRWLQEAGFPLLIRRGRRGGVTLLPGGALDTSRLTPDERDHLVLRGLDDRQHEQLGATADGRRALRKVRSGAVASDTATLPLSAVVVTDNSPWFSRPPEGTPPAALLGDLRRAVRLRIRYRRSTQSEGTWRVVDPYGLLAKAGRWYLVADHSGRPRLYALERLIEWQPLRVPRRPRPGVGLADAAAELTAGWEGAAGLRVQAELDQRQLDRARRILGSRLTVHPATAADRVRVTVAVQGLEGLHSLLQFGDSLTVTGPPEARERIRLLAEGIVRQYS